VPLSTAANSELVSLRRLVGRRDAVADAIAEQARVDTTRVRIAMPVDPGQAGLAQKYFYTKLLAGYVVNLSPESGNKKTCAEQARSPPKGGRREKKCDQAQWSRPSVGSRQPWKQMISASSDLRVVAIKRIWYKGSRRSGVPADSERPFACDHSGNDRPCKTSRPKGFA